jgi:hypothetical protein
MHEVEVPGVELDEVHAKLCPRHLAWIHTALAMESWLLLWIDVGPRTQEHAAALVAQVVARGREVPLLLTDGWKASSAALLQVVGIVYGRWTNGSSASRPTPGGSWPYMPPAAACTNARRSVERYTHFGSEKRQPIGLELIRCADALWLQTAAHFGQEFMFTEGFDDIVVCTSLIALLAVLRRRFRRHHNDFGVS